MTKTMFQNKFSLSTGSYNLLQDQLKRLFHEKNETCCIFSKYFILFKSLFNVKNFYAPRCFAWSIFKCPENGVIFASKQKFAGSTDSDQALESETP